MLVVARARKVERFLSQPFSVAEVFTGSPGKYVPLKETIRGFKGIIDGEYDNLPEQAFYMVSSVAVADEKKLLGELTVQTRLTHSETLLPHIQQVLEMAGVAKNQLKAVAVSLGPGSFTGLLRAG